MEMLTSSPFLLILSQDVKKVLVFSKRLFFMHLQIRAVFFLLHFTSEVVLTPEILSVRLQIRTNQPPVDK